MNIDNIPVDQRRFKHLIFYAILFYGFLLVLTFAQLLIPPFYLNFVLVFVLMIISRVIFYILNFIVLYIRILSTITLIILLSFYIAIVFLLANNLSVFSIIIINLYVPACFIIFMYWTYLVRIQIISIPTMGDFKSVTIISTVILLMGVNFSYSTKSLDVLGLVCLSIHVFTYLIEVAELLMRSVQYKGFYMLEGIITLTSMIWGQYTLLMLICYVVKAHGLIIFLPFPPWYYVFPSELFTCL